MIKNVTLPSLMFSRIVSAFSVSNVGTLGKKLLFISRNHSGHQLRLPLGPLILVALLYEAIGIAISWIIKQLFWVPHRFRYGILAAGGWGNIGDVRECQPVYISSYVPSSTMCLDTYSNVGCHGPYGWPSVQWDI